jgi:hypothetical protein
MYAIYGNIYHQYTPNVSIYTIHGSYGHDEAWKMPEKNQDDEIFQRFTPTVGITKPIYVILGPSIDAKKPVRRVRFLILPHTVRLSLQVLF